MAGRLLFFGLLLNVAVPSVDASEAFQFTSTVDRDSITIGDRIALRLDLRRHHDDTSTVIPDLRLPATFEVLESPRATSARVDGDQLITQTIELTSFKTGAYTIPPPVVQIVRAAGDTLRLESPSIDIIVGSVKPEGIEDITDIHDPVVVQPRIPWWAWALLCCFVALAAAAIWFFFRKKAAPAPPPRPPDWFEEIRRIGRSGLVEAGDFLTYYTSLSEALRRFLEDRTGVEAMERTTDEVGDDLSVAGLGSGRVVDVQGFLSEADLVKFAKFAPGPDRARQDLIRVLDAMGGIDADLKPFVGTEESTGEGADS